MLITLFGDCFPPYQPSASREYGNKVTGTIRCWAGFSPVDASSTPRLFLMHNRTFIIRPPLADQGAAARLEVYGM